MRISFRDRLLKKHAFIRHKKFFIIIASHVGV